MVTSHSDPEVQRLVPPIMTSLGRHSSLVVSPSPLATKAQRQELARTQSSTQTAVEWNLLLRGILRLSTEEGASSAADPSSFTITESKSSAHRNGMPRTEPGSVLLLTRDAENAFVDLLVATFRQYNSFSWKSKDWNDMALKLHRDHNFVASSDKLQHKFHRLKSNYKKFEELLNHTGVGWDPLLETITCPEDVRLKFEKEKRGYSLLLQQGFPHYEKLHEILRGRLATRGMAIDSANPPTPMQLHAMETSYIANQLNMRAGKQPMSEPQESTGSSDSPPPSAERRRSAQRNMPQNRRRKAGDLRSDPIIGEAIDMIRTFTSRVSPSGTGTTKKSKSVSSPQKSDTQDCMDLANLMRKDITDDEYVDLIMLMRDDFNRTSFLTIAGPADALDVGIVKTWI